MGQIVQYRGRELPAARDGRQIDRQLSRSFDRMERMADLTMAGLDELGRIHDYAAWSVARSLQNAEILREVLARAGTPASLGYEAASQRIRGHYLLRVDQVLDASGQRLVEAVDQGGSASPDGGLVGRIAHWFGG